jgi:type IV pilus assembly protein PilM
MAWRKKNRMGLGLDLGSACFKSVVLSLQDGRPVLVRQHTLNLRAQGILNEADFYAAAGDWLQRTGCTGLPTAVGLPQFLSTTQLTDFPAGSGKTGLSDMVAFETRQLAGLSDEEFVHDYHVLPPGFGRRNPVLIGICRESVIRERMAALQQAGVAAPRLAMSGLAAVNALVHLHQEAADGQQPVLLVDIGQENSTAVVLAGGQPLFVGSLLFGAEKLVKAVMTREDLQEAAAEAHLATVDLMEESHRSALVQAARKLVAEIEDAVNHWRAQERQELNEAPLSAVWLCGGAARLKGLATYLRDALQCPVQVFGPQDPQGGQPMPEMAVAFGLALQTLNLAKVTIDLTPADVRHQAHRARRFGFLAAACVLFTTFLAGLLERAVGEARAELTALRAEMVELDACEQLIPRLEEARREIDRHEAALVPLLQAGNRGGRFVEALDALATVCGEKDWLVYLGDEGSYKKGALANDPRAAAAAAAAAQDAIGGFPGGEQHPVVGATVVVPEFPCRRLARQAPGTPSLIAAGYTPKRRDQPWEATRDIIEKLRDLGPYSKVELLLEVERVGRADIFDPWVQYYAGQPGALYAPFSLRLTLALPDVAETVSAQGPAHP